MFKKVNWLPFKELVKYKQACLIYKSKTDQAPSYIQNLCTKFVSHSKSLSYLGVGIWNSIPNDIRQAESWS